MSVRPFQKVCETLRKGGRPSNIHLWVLQECDGCGRRQEFAAGPDTQANIRERMQDTYYCRSCRRDRQGQPGQQTSVTGWSS